MTNKIFATLKRLMSTVPHSFNVRDIKLAAEMFDTF